MSGSVTLRVALGEYDSGWHDPESSLRGAEAVVERAAAGGARLVVLPEMTTTGFTMDVAQATPLDDGHAGRLAAIAARHGVWLVASVAATERSAGTTRAVNAAIAADPRGEIRAVYRKQKLFAFAGEHEHYLPGEEPVIVGIEGVRVALFVCYDLRFPELFRAVARDVDAFVLVANWPAARRAHWDTLTRARAIENQAFMVAVNRVGRAGGIDYDGGSVAYDPWGDRLAEHRRAPGDPAIVALDAARVAEVRKKYPFLEDIGTPQRA
ncbi:MAG: carbon-nitrogen family hydrolase [Gemmatimonadaceae bacterium]|nr:carbon-nitrogen family hydrolase [Gemmatimonadaceae bacterium]NUQ91745.1 carbon-nitrogen family hydrolase [Gemmatimonadaceae bacterium]